MSIMCVKQGFGGKSVKVTPLEEYGIRLSLQIARKGPGGSATIPELAKSEALTPAYAAKVLARLRKGGVVNSLRGRHAGGYQLARPANEITVLDIMNVMGGKLYTTDFCGKHSGNHDECVHTTDCSVRSLWNGLEFFLNGLLSQYKLSDLMDPARMMEIWIKNAPAKAPLRMGKN
jgi:Rrf2 family transcriptional regulator, iron-sulfur cluster assembly transcription factor